MPFQSVINSLQLQYPPISNQEAEWLKEDPEVVSLMKKSRLYMIGQRQELLFDEPSFNPLTGELEISFHSHTGEICKGAIDLGMQEVISALMKDQKVDIEAGPKMVRISTPDQSGMPDKILRWYTVDLLLFNKWRRDPALHGFENYRDFSRYSLLYVGIATKGDSYERLIERAHEKRLAVLSNEKQLKPDARLTDEIILFFFDSNPLMIRTFDVSSSEDFSLIAADPPYTDNQSNIDAEKAFVFFFKAKYNTVLYKGFPKSTDGFYGLNIDRYMHVINEDLELITESGSFKGGFGNGLPCSRDCDAIYVEGDHAQLLKHGVA
jgi:hypothetical protein